MFLDRMAPSDPVDNVVVWTDDEEPADHRVHMLLPDHRRKLHKPSSLSIENEEILDELAQSEMSYPHDEYKKPPGGPRRMVRSGDSSRMLCLMTLHRERTAIANKQASKTLEPEDGRPSPWKCLPPRILTLCHLPDLPVHILDQDPAFLPEWNNVVLDLRGPLDLCLPDQHRTIKNHPIEWVPTNM